MLQTNVCNGQEVCQFLSLFGICTLLKSKDHLFEDHLLNVNISMTVGRIFTKKYISLYLYFGLFLENRKNSVSHRVKMMTRWPGRERWLKWPIDSVTQWPSSMSDSFTNKHIKQLKHVMIVTWLGLQNNRLYAPTKTYKKNISWYHRLPTRHWLILYHVSHDVGRWVKTGSPLSTLNRWSKKSTNSVNVRSLQLNKINAVVIKHAMDANCVFQSCLPATQYISAWCVQDSLSAAVQNSPGP